MKEKIINLIDFEINAINNLKNNFQNKKYLKNFENVSNNLFNAKKIIFSGVGKSILPAKNIVSLLRSLSIQTDYLDVQNASHGDLGIINNDSVIIFFSKSGNTKEILNIIPEIKKRNAKIILITSNKNSNIAKISNFVINYDLNNESLPIENLPTTSTILSIILCNIFLLLLINKKKISNDIFAKNHPGGEIGKNLNSNVFDLMHKDIPIANFNTTFQDLLILITEKKMGTIIIEKNNCFAGIITDGDIRRFIIKNKDFSNFSIQKILNKKPIILNKNIKFFEALKIFKEKNIKFLPVVISKKCIGIIDFTNL